MSRFAEALRWTAFCRAIGMKPDSDTAIAHQVNAKVALARREALEEAARICADLARHDCSALYAGECIRILIGKEPA